jgi:hypothetical protein
MFVLLSTQDDDAMVGWANPAQNAWSRPCSLAPEEARIMRTAAALILLGLIATPLEAQGRRSGRYGDRAQGIPPGHLPPPGECRVWYDDRPAGHQPPPTSCREAERVASRDRYARVIYGGYDDRRDDGRWDRDDDRRDDGRWDRDDDRRNRDRGRAIPRRDPRYPYPDRNRYPENRYPYPDPYGRGGYGFESVPFENGYKDGYDKGREDARDNDAYDPRRHSRYRSGDHGYNRRYGSKDEYRNIYREGFQTGYEEGYRDVDVYGTDRRRNDRRFPWPF